jgi:hypothetical protein
MNHYQEQVEHYRLCDEAKSLGIPTSLDDPRAPRTLDGLREAIAVERGKREILADVRAGRVPADVEDFSALHDHVDANEYGGLCDDFGECSTDFANRVQDALDAWIRTRPFGG